MPILKRVGFPDIRLLTVTINQPVTLHFITRHHKQTAQPIMLFLLREIDAKIIRPSCFGGAKSDKTEQSVRTLINSICKDHMWTSPEELKALKAVNILPLRAPKAALISSVTLIDLLRNFSMDINALALETTLICLQNEASILHRSMLGLKGAVAAANKKYGHPSHDSHTIKLLQKISPHYPPPWQPYFFSAPFHNKTNVPIFDLKTSVIFSNLVNNPRHSAAVLPWFSLVPMNDQLLNRFIQFELAAIGAKFNQLTEKQFKIQQEQFRLDQLQQQLEQQQLWQQKEQGQEHGNDDKNENGHQQSLLQSHSNSLQQQINHSLSPQSTQSPQGLGGGFNPIIDNIDLGYQFGLFQNSLQNTRLDSSTLTADSTHLTHTHPINIPPPPLPQPPPLLQPPVESRPVPFSSTLEAFRIQSDKLVELKQWIVATTIQNQKKQKELMEKWQHLQNSAQNPQNQVQNSLNESRTRPQNPLNINTPQSNTSLTSPKASLLLTTPTLWDPISIADDLPSVTIPLAWRRHVAEPKGLISTAVASVPIPITPNAALICAQLGYCPSDQKALNLSQSGSISHNNSRPGSPRLLATGSGSAVIRTVDNYGTMNDMVPVASEITGMLTINEKNDPNDQDSLDSDNNQHNSIHFIPNIRSNSELSKHHTRHSLQKTQTTQTTRTTQTTQTTQTIKNPQDFPGNPSTSLHTPGENDNNSSFYSPTADIIVKSGVDKNNMIFKTVFCHTKHGSHIFIAFSTRATNLTDEPPNITRSQPQDEQATAYREAFLSKLASSTNSTTTKMGSNHGTSGKEEFTLLSTQQKIQNLRTKMLQDNTDTSVPANMITSAPVFPPPQPSKNSQDESQSNTTTARPQNDSNIPYNPPSELSIESYSSNGTYNTSSNSHSTSHSYDTTPLQTSTGNLLVPDHITGELIPVCNAITRDDNLDHIIHISVRHQLPCQIHKHQHNDKNIVSELRQLLPFETATYIPFVSQFAFPTSRQNSDVGSHCLFVPHKPISSSFISFSFLPPLPLSGPRSRFDLFNDYPHHILFAARTRLYIPNSLATQLAGVPNNIGIATCRVARSMNISRIISSSQPTIIAAAAKAGENIQYLETHIVPHDPHQDGGENHGEDPILGVAVVSTCDQLRPELPHSFSNPLSLQQLQYDSSAHIGRDGKMVVDLNTFGTTSQPLSLIPVQQYNPDGTTLILSTTTTTTLSNQPQSNHTNPTSTATTTTTTTPTTLSSRQITTSTTHGLTQPTLSSSDSNSNPNRKTIVWNGNEFNQYIALIQESVTTQPSAAPPKPSRAVTAAAQNTGLKPKAKRGRKSKAELALLEAQRLAVENGTAVVVSGSSLFGSGDSSFTGGSTATIADRHCFLADESMTPSAQEEIDDVDTRFHTVQHSIPVPPTTVRGFNEATNAYHVSSFTEFAISHFATSLSHSHMKLCKTCHTECMPAIAQDENGDVLSSAQENEKVRETEYQNILEGQHLQINSSIYLMTQNVPKCRKRVEFTEHYLDCSCLCHLHFDDSGNLIPYPEDSLHPATDITPAPALTERPDEINQRSDNGDAKMNTHAPRDITNSTNPIQSTIHLDQPHQSAPLHQLSTPLTQLDQSSQVSPTQSSQLRRSSRRPSTTKESETYTQTTSPISTTTTTTTTVPAPQPKETTPKSTKLKKSQTTTTTTATTPSTTATTATTTKPQTSGLFIPRSKFELPILEDIPPAEPQFDLPKCPPPRSRIVPEEVQFLSLPGAVPFSLLVLNALSYFHARSTPGRDIAVITSSDYACEVVSASFAWLMSQLKRPVTYSTTLVEFDNATLASFFPNSSPPDVALVSDIASYKFDDCDTLPLYRDSDDIDYPPLNVKPSAAPLDKNFHYFHPDNVAKRTDGLVVGMLSGIFEIPEFQSRFLDDSHLATYYPTYQITPEIAYMQNKEISRVYDYIHHDGETADGIGGIDEIDEENHEMGFNHDITNPPPHIRSNGYEKSASIQQEQFPYHFQQQQKPQYDFGDVNSDLKGTTTTSTSNDITTTTTTTTTSTTATPLHTEPFPVIPPQGPTNATQNDEPATSDVDEYYRLSESLFPYDITEQTLPIWRSWLWHFENFAHLHRFRLFRHANCFYNVYPQKNKLVSVRNPTPPNTDTNGLNTIIIEDITMGDNTDESNPHLQNHYNNHQNSIVPQSTTANDASIDGYQTGKTSNSATGPTKRRFGQTTLQNENDQNNSISPLPSESVSPPATTKAKKQRTRQNVVNKGQNDLQELAQLINTSSTSSFTATTTQSNHPNQSSLGPNGDNLNQLSQQPLQNTGFVQNSGQNNDQNGQNSIYTSQHPSHINTSMPNNNAPSQYTSGMTNIQNNTNNDNQYHNNQKSNSHQDHHYDHLQSTFSLPTMFNQPNPNQYSHGPSNTDRTHHHPHNSRNDFSRMGYGLSGKESLPPSLSTSLQPNRHNPTISYPHSTTFPSSSPPLHQRQSIQSNSPIEKSAKSSYTHRNPTLPMGDIDCVTPVSPSPIGVASFYDSDRYQLPISGPSSPTMRSISGDNPQTGRGSLGLGSGGPLDYFGHSLDYTNTYNSGFMAQMDMFGFELPPPVMGIHRTNSSMIGGSGLNNSGGSNNHDSFGPSFGSSSHHNTTNLQSNPLQLNSSLHALPPSSLTFSTRTLDKNNINPTFMSQNNSTHWIGTPLFAPRSMIFDTPQSPGLGLHQVDQIRNSNQNPNPNHQP